MEQRGNHPSIVLWVVFNEAWGQFDTVEVTRDVMATDPSRLVTGASGWDDHPVGHIMDLHVYPGRPAHWHNFSVVSSQGVAPLGLTPSRFLDYFSPKTTGKWQI